MSRQRAKIRNTLTELLTGSTSVGDNVHAARTIPQREEELPAVHVYTDSEAVSPLSDAPRTNMRIISATFEVITKGETGAEANDLADEICEEIEEIIDAEDNDVNGVLGCLINSAVVNGSNTEQQPDGDSAIVSVRLSYSIEYVKDTALPSNVNEAERIVADWDIGTANDPDPEASDLIELR